MERLECKEKLLRQSREGVLDSAGREAGTFSRHVERLLEALESQYSGLTVNVTQRFEVWCGQEMSELKVFSVKNI